MVGVLVGFLLGSVGVVVAADTFLGYPVVNVVVNGKSIQSDTPGVIIEGRTMLPVRAIADTLGLDVKWDGATKTVTLTSKVAAPKDSVYSDQYVSVSNVTVRKTSLNVTEILMEVTGVNKSTVSGILAVTFYDANGAILGKASGAVLELAPGSTKTVSLLETGDLTKAASYKVQTEAMFTQ